MVLPGLAKAPPLRLLERKRLTELFERASQARIVLCVAPPGHGKTVALEQFLDARGTEAIRIVPDEAYGGLFSFVRSLASELSRALDRPELSFSAVYDRVAASVAPEAELARWLRSQIPSHELCITIDNLERAAADGRTVRFLDSIVRETPQFKWHLLSRTAGSLPVPNWMADGLMDFPIDQDALAFDTAETLQLGALYGKDLSPENAAALDSQLGGWALGLCSRFRYGSPFEDVRYDQRNPAEAYRSLLERCYRACSDAESDLLLDTALMHRLHPAALQVLGWKNAERKLRALRAHFPHFFNSACDVLTYGDLTRAYLVDRLRDRGAQACSSAVERCGGALERAGQPGEALSLYVEHAAAGAIGALLERHGFPLVDGGYGDLVNAALRILPGEPGIARPVTLALRGSYEASLGRSDVAEAWFVHALRQSGGAIHDEITYRHACDLLRRQRVGLHRIL